MPRQYRQFSHYALMFCFNTKIAALVLAGFTLSTNFIFHDFWTMDGDRAALELSLFFKNVSIAGGLVLLGGMSGKK